jgi:hypothetical protein
VNGQLNQIIITVNQIDAWQELYRGRKVAVGRGMKFEGDREIIDVVIAFDGIVVAIADTFVTIIHQEQGGRRIIF